MKSGYYVSKTRAVLLVLLVIIIIIIVGLLAGLLGKSCSNGESDDDGKSTSQRSSEATTLPPEEPGPWQDPFLPSHTKPVHYNLSFYPDFYFNGTTFSGRADIVINVTEATRYLIVHYKLMNITKTTVRHLNSGNNLEVKRNFPFHRNEYWVTELEDELKADSTVVLHMEFEGSLVYGIVGYYKSTYINTQTRVRSWLATTKFQPTDARKAFPCFDEPHQKATFTIQLRHWKNFTALSNMPISEQEDIDDIWRKTTFEKSLVMPVYLVCFIVCDFRYQENTIDRTGISHKVWASPDKLQQTNYALRVGKIITDAFQDEFDINYHLPKLDQIAVPDFPSGAMEHWGLITYRETALLYDANQVTSSGKERVVQVVAHELAHNYFGNVITCRWWDEIWLNEGFARFYQYFGMDIAEPTWDMEDYFAIATQQGVMSIDASTSSRPVVVHLTHPDQINEAFDSITYNKGGSMLRMMEGFLGKDTFRNAMRRYLNAHLFGSVVTDDLWRAIQEEIGDELNITEVMRPWLYQMGLPVVNVKVVNNQIQATQTRFLANPDADPKLPESPFGYKWYIPLTYQTSRNQEDTIWMNGTNVTFRDPRSSSNDWIKFNRRQKGFYRVNYSPEMWQQLINQLQSRHTAFRPIDRSNLLDDAFSLASSTLLDYTTVLSMTEYMVNENDYFPWSTVRIEFNYIGTMLYGHPEYHLWRKYVNDITKRIMQRVGVRADGGHLQRLLRRDVMGLACSNDNKENCIQPCVTLFQRWIDNPDRNPVPADLRPQVYKYGFKEVGGVQEWDIMWGRYVNATSVQEKNYILNAMAKSQDVWLIQRYLSYVNDESKVRIGDFFNAVNYLNSNAVGRLYAWDWVKQHYASFVKRFGVGSRYFGRMVPRIVSRFKTEYHLKEVEDFLAQYPNAGAGTAGRNNALDSIRTNIAWLQRNEETIINWLRQYHGISRK